MESSVNPREARAALDAVQQSKSDLADRVYTPWWYHPILGVLCGGLVTAATVGAPLAAVLGAVAAFGLGVAVLSKVYWRRIGVQVTGYPGPRTRAAAMIAVSVGLALAAVSAVLGLALDLPWAAVAVGAAVAVLTVVWGRRFDAILRAELRGSA